VARNYRYAVELQKKLSSLRRQVCLPEPVRTVGGADVAFSPDGRYCVAAVVVLGYPGFEELERVYACKRVTFPYIPGLLSFREAPAIVAAAGKLSGQPDVMLVDGQGTAHPRRFGLACHVGVELGWPTIGCAKSRLTGTHRQPGQRKGCRCRLMDGNEVIGTVLRSREAVKCIYISEGHLTRLDQAVRLVLRCCVRYRLPEPIRSAHNLVTQLRANRKVWNQNEL
jgi:deoxyribonuclease V